MVNVLTRVNQVTMLSAWIKANLEWFYGSMTTGVIVISAHVFVYFSK